MKKFYMQEKVISAKETFYVKNEAEENCYLVEGDMVQIGGKKLHIKDLNGVEIAMLQQKLLSLRPKFFIFKHDQQVGELVKKIGIKPKYFIDGLGWEISGKFLAHDYTISDGTRDIVKIHKAWISIGGCYELDVEDDVDDAMVIAAVLAIETVMASTETNTEINING